MNGVSLTLALFLVIVIYKFYNLKKKTKIISDTLKDSFDINQKLIEDFNKMKNIHIEVNKKIKEEKEKIDNVTKKLQDIQARIDTESLKNKLSLSYFRALNSSKPLISENIIKELTKSIDKIKIDRKNSFIKTVNKCIEIRNFENLKKSGTYLFYNAIAASTILMLIKMGLFETFKTDFINSLSDYSFISFRNDPYLSINDFKLKDSTTNFDSTDLNIQIDDKFLDVSENYKKKIISKYEDLNI